MQDGGWEPQSKVGPAERNCQPEATAQKCLCPRPRKNTVKKKGRLPVADGPSFIPFSLRATDSDLPEPARAPLRRTFGARVDRV